MKGQSLRTAIDQYCKECVYDKLCPGTWRQQVAQCTAKECPLWDVRPRAATSLSPDTTKGQDCPEKCQFEDIAGTLG